MKKVSQLRDVYLVYNIYPLLPDVIFISDKNHDFDQQVITPTIRYSPNVQCTEFKSEIYEFLDGT